MRKVMVTKEEKNTNSKTPDEHRGGSVKKVIPTTADCYSFTYN